VSGSTAGIGLAIAAALAAEGAKVVVNGRTQARVDAALKTIQQAVASADLRGVPADLGTAAGVDGFLRQIPRLTYSSTILASLIPNHSWKFLMPTGCASLK